MSWNPKIMKWLNPPAKWHSDTQKLVMYPNPKSDFWRKTHYGFTFDTGSFYYTTCDKEFEISTKITGHYQNQYDQMGIMIRIDKNTWVKTGIEFVDQKVNISAVVTHSYSDWNMLKLETNPESVRIKVIRNFDALEIFYALNDQNFQLMRIAYFPENTSCMAGLMAASPTGKGFKAVFEEIKINKNI